MKKILLLLFAFILSNCYQKSFAQSVEAGEYYTILLCNSGTPKGTGSNGNGQLGIGFSSWDENLPVATNLTGVIAISGGESHTLILKSDGTVWAYGANWIGQLGDGTNDDADTAVQVSGLTGVTAIAAGRSFSFALKSNGTVWAWGANWNGRLGDGTGNHSNIPVQVSGLSNVTAISAGYDHALAVKSNGTAWAWGSNGNGQLGDGTNTDKYAPVQVIGMSGITSVAGGAEHSLALKSNGSVWAWGANWASQLGDGTNNPTNLAVQVSGFSGGTRIAAGAYHSLAIKSNGTGWAWGSNGNGQLGDGTTNNRNLPVQINGLSNIISISGGYEHSTAVRNDDTFWAWGYNGYGQLGNGTYDNTSSPVQMHDCCSSAPGIALSDNCIIDTTEIGGSSNTTFIIRNFRCTALDVTNIASSNAAFTVSTTSVSVPSYDSVMITVTYAPTILGNNPGTLTIFNNAGDTTMCLAGYCLQAPEITKNPSSFNVALGCNAASTSTLTIGNTGLGTLDFDMAIEPSVTSAVFYDGFESGGITSWNSGVDTFINATTTINPASGTYCLEMTPTYLSGDEYEGLNHTFTNNTPDYISFKIKTPNIPIWNSSSVIIGNSNDISYNGGLAYFDIYNDGGNRIIELGTYSNYYTYPLNENQWYTIAYRNINYTNKTFDFYIDGNLIGSGISFLNSDITSLDVVHLFSQGYFTTLYDDIFIGYDPNLWLSISPSSGTVAPSGSTNLNVNFNSANLPDGVYYGNVIANSNDPVTPQVLVPCTLTVAGDPDIDMSLSSCTNYNTIMVGATHEQNFQVDNVGCDTLHISNVTSSSGQFMVNSFPAVVPPFASDIVTVTFQPSLAATHTATISVLNDDADTTFCVQGIALPAPTLSVTPAAFSMTAACSQSVTSTLTISNTGTADLTWNLTIISGINNGGFETGSFSPWTVLETIHTPSASPTTAHSGTYAAFVGSHTGNQSGNSSIYQTITVPASGGILNFWYKPYTVDGISWDWQDAYITNTSGTTLATIMHVCSNSQTWTNINYNLAAFAGQTIRIKFLVHNDGSSDRTMMYVDDVSVNFPSIVTAAPLTGTTSPSSTSSVSVTFNSAGLVVGTYTSAITVNSNDPVNSTVQVPCTFTVTGSPDIDIPILGCPSFNTTMVGATDQDTFLVQNLGCDTLHISNTTSSSGEFIVNSFPSVIPPFGSNTITVTFDPTIAATHSTTITVVNDDPNDPNETFCLQGVCIPAATITVTPAFFNVAINSCDDVVTSTLTINNPGGSNLNYYIDTTFKYGYVCNSGSNNVSVFNLLTNTIVGSPIVVGSFPWRAAVRPDGKFIYVSNRNSNTVSVINTATNTVITTISIGGQPSGIAFTSNSKFAYVGDRSNDNIKKIDCATNTVIKTIVNSNFSDPEEIAITPNNQKAYVATTSTGVTVIDLTTDNVIANIPNSTINGAFSVIITADGQYAYVSGRFSNNVRVISTSSNTVSATITGFNAPHDMDITQNGSFIYMVDKSNARIAKISTTTNAVVSYINDARLTNAEYIRLSPDNKYAFITNPSPGVATDDVMILDLTTNTIINTLSTASNARDMATLKKIIVPFMSVNPSFGTVTPSGSNTVAVTFNSSEVIAGTHTTTISVVSNDPLNPQVNIPCTLTVTGSPEIAFSAPCLNFGPQILGSTVKDSVLLTNTGCDTLKISNILVSPSVYTVTPTSGDVVPGQSAYIKVTFAPFAAASYTGTVTIQSNISDATFCLSGTGVSALPLSVPLATGINHSLAICSLCNDGFAWGWNPYGQLGDSTTTDRHTRTLIKLAGITAIAGGEYHSTGLKSDGSVWSWGNNGNGQLGDGTTLQRITPVQVSGLTGTSIAIAAGRFYSLALKGNGSVWSWGNNGNGQLGDGTTSQRLTPVQVSNLTGVTAIAAGMRHSLALKSDSTVWAWGYNGNGQLGDSSTTQSTTPVKVKNGLTGIIAIAAGRDHSIALKSDGTVWAWGYNGSGQLGDSSTAQRTAPVKVKNGLTGIIAIAGGGDHSLALKSDGTVWAWGYNGYGQLGNGNTGTNRTAPVQVSGLTTATAIAAGNYHSLAMKNDETVWAWGYNGYGQLGDGTTTNRNVPVQTKYLCPPKQVDIDIPLLPLCTKYDTLLLGDNDPKSFKVYNKGCDTLHISSVTSSSLEFTVVSFPFKIAPVDSGMIIVSLTPTNTGTVATTITVADNDPDPDTSFCLEGVVIAAPVISTLPTSISYTLACCDSVTLPLEISNSTGGSDLKWSVNNTLNFNGSSSYVQMNNSIVFDVNQLTIESWVYADDYNQLGFIFEKGPVNSQYSLFFEWGSLVFRTYSSGGGCGESYYLPSASIGITNGSWHHIAATFDGSTKKVYVDGVLRGTSSFTCPLRTGQPGEIIGAYGGTGSHSYYYNGNISDVRIWNYARSQAQIANNMHNQINPLESGLVSYYPLSEGMGSTLHDKTVNNNNGTSNNTSWIFNPADAFQGFSFTPATGTVGIGGEDTLDVTFNSCGLTIGTYTTQIIISSNDPLKTKDTIPLTLNVVGTPEVNTFLFDSTGNCLDLDSIMAFTSSTDTIAIFNSGCDTLFINSLQFSNSAFDSVYAPGYILLGDTDMVVVRFAPSFSVAITTTVTGTVTVHTNDNTVDSVICLHGEVFPQPIQMHVENSYSITLGCNDTIVDSLIIYNTGGSDLMFGIMGGKLTRKIALVAADDNSHIMDVQTKLLASGKFSAVDVFNAAFSTPTLSYLQNYDAVLVWSWWNGFSDPNLLGDNLADYSDGGGAVVTAMWTGYLGGSYQILGRFNSDYYWCIAPNWTNSGIQTLGTIYNSTHPILDGVTSFNGGNASYRPSTSSVYPGADRIANWSDGMPLIVTRTINGSNRVDLGLWPVSSDAYGDGWDPTTDGAQMIANALYWAGGGGVDWMTLSPRVDTVEYGGSDSTIVEVEFTSTNFTVGTYTTNIIINSNDPLNSPDTVTVTLNITGAPKVNFALLDSAGNCLDLDSIMAYTESTDTITVFNTGCDTLFIKNLQFSSSAFDSAYAPNYILPGDTEGVVVRFAPSFSVAITTTVTGTVTVHTNDNTVDSVLCLQGKVFPQPVIFIDPNSFDTTLFCSDTLHDTITIHNTGLGTLIYNIDTVDYSAVFDGNGDYIYNFSSTLPTGNVMTAEAWIYPFASPTSSYNGIISWGQYSCTNKMILAIQSTGRPSMTTGCYNFIPSSGPTATINQWNHIACVLNGTSVTLYMNGIPVNGTLSGLPDVQPSPLYLGYNDYHGYYFNGKIDEARIWNTARTQAEILGTMNKELIGNEPGLVSYWNFDSINANDLAGTNDGSLNDNTYFAPDQPNKFYSLNGTLNGTLAPGDSSQIAIEFTSTGFLAGNYLDSIMVSSNDPQNNLTAVHLDLTVDGIAQANYFLFDSIGNCLYLDSIMESTTSTDTVGITNTGCDTLFIYNLNFTDGAYSTIYSPPYILPGDTDVVIVQFAPLSTGTITCNMTVNTNVGSPVICLYGKSFAKPVQCHDPDSYNAHFTICQDSIVDTLNICNTLGLGNLNYNLWSPYGRSAQFDGNSDYIDVPDNNSLDLPTKVTFETWLYVNSTPDVWTGIIGKPGRNYTMWLNNNRYIHLSYYNGSFSNITINTPVNSINLNQWHHVAGVIDVGAGVMKIYIDGVEQASGPTGGTAMLSNVPFIMGRNLDNNPWYFLDGKLDEVRVWNIARTQSEIQSTIKSTLTGSEYGLVGYWNFDDSTATDFSSNSNDGTLQNGAFITAPNVEFNPAPTGTVTPGGTYSVQVVFKKEGLAPGTYNVPIYLNSNDPINALDTVNVTFDIDGTPPTPPTAGSNAPICAGTDLSLTASTIPGATYSWTGPNTFSSSAQNPVIPNATTAASGTYSVTATTNSCTSTPGTTTVTVNPPPSTPSAGSNSTVCSGKTLSLTATSISGASYSWIGPNSFTSSSQNPIIINVSTSASGTYSVTATVPGCPPTAAGTTSVVINATPSVPSASSNSPICVGSDLSLTASMITGVTYAWTGPNTFTDATQYPVIPNATTAATGTYSVTATANGCTSAPGTTTVTVNPPPSAPTAGSNSTVCSGKTLSLTASAISGATYSWTGPNTFSAASQNPTIPNVTTDAAGTYSVTATVGGCPTTSAGTTTVVINPTPVAPSASSNAPVCVGSDLSLTASTVGSSTYAWTGPSSFTSSSQYPVILSMITAKAGTYSVTATELGCTGATGTTTVVVNVPPAAPTALSNSPVCVGSELSLSAGTISGATYAWTGPNTFSSSSQYPTIPNVGTIEAGTYSVIATKNGCTGTAGTTTVIVNPPPAVPSASSNSTVCSGQTLSLTASTVTGATYSWTGPLSYTSTSQYPTISSVTTSRSGTYSVTASIPGCPPSAPGTTLVTINQTPLAPTAGNNSPICEGTDLSLTANSTSPGATYSWTGPNLFSDASQNPVIVNATIAATGTYSVTASAGGCTGPRGTTSATVNPAPAPPNAGSNSTVCSGQTLSLTANTIASATYAWTGPNTFISSLQNPTIPTVTTGAAGTYSVTATVPGCPTTAAGTTAVAINQTPVAPSASSNSPVCVGDDLSLTAGTIPGATYAWTGPNSFSSSLQDPVISPASTAETGTYSVTATVGGCTGPKGTTSATVNPPPSAPSAGSNSTVCSGKTLSLTANTIASAAYSWTGPSGLTSTLQNPAFASITTADAGTYSVTATVPGCPTSPVGTTTVSINQTPVAPAAGSNSPVCSGNTLSLTASTVGSSTYAWMGPATFSSTLQDPIRVSVTTAMAGTYSVTATENGCLSPAGTVSVTIYQTPAAPSAGSNSPVCTGFTLSLTANAVSGATYAWTGPNSYSNASQNPTIGNVSSSDAGTYAVNATVNGCTGPTATVTVTINTTPSAPAASSNSPVCSGTTLSLSASAAGSPAYNWSGPNSFASGLQNPPIGSITTLGNGTYSVTATAGGCTGPAGTVSVTVYQTPAAPMAGSNTPICAGQDLSLTASTVGSSTYNWSGPNSFSSTLQNTGITSAALTDAGTYSVTATENGCTGSAGTVNAIVNPPPAVPTAGSNSPVCSGQTLSLTANSTSPGATYSWTGPDTFNSSSQNPSIPNVTTNAAGTYSVTASVAGCPPSAATTAVVTINQTPAAPTTSSNSPICVGSDLSLTAGTISGASYAWTGPNSYSSAAQNPTIINAATNNSGTYSVTASANGCTGTAGTISVTVNPPPTAPSAGSNSAICSGQTLSLTASTVSGVTYSWSGPNSFSSTAQNPTIVNASTNDAGTYSVIVIAAGCPPSTAATATVVINQTPAAPATSSNSPVCVGSDLSLTAGTISGVTYAWSGPGGFASSSQNPTIASAATNNSGTYSVTASAGGCTGAAGATTVIVNPPPSAPAAGSNSTVCSGQTLSLTASTLPGVTYSWNGPNSFSSSSQDPTIANVSTDAAGTYSVTVIAAGCPPSAAATTTVAIHQTPSAPVAGSNSPVCAGTDLSLTASTISGVTYAWTGPNSYSAAAQNPTIISATTNNAGTYSVTAIANGCASSSGTVTATVNYTPPPVAPDVAVCAGSTVPPLTAAGTNIQWYDSLMAPVFSGSPYNTGINTIGSYTYYVTQTNTITGCTSVVDTVTLVIGNVPTLPPTVHDTGFCAGQTASLMALTGTIVQWYTDAALTNYISTGSSVNLGAFTTPGVYTYYVTDSTPGCPISPAGTVSLTISTPPAAPVANDTFGYAGISIPQLIATTGSNIQWYDTSGALVYSGNPFNTAQTTIGTYTYTLTQSPIGCESPPDTVILTIYPGAPISNDTSICEGQLCPDLTASGTNIIWYNALGVQVATGNPYNPALTVAGTYTFYATQTVNNLTSPSDTILLTINVFPLKPTANNVAICYGAPAVLTTTGNTPQWYSDATLINMVGAGSPFNTGLTSVGTYTYYVTDFAAGCGNSPSDTAVITINPLSLVTANTYSTTIVQGDSIVLIAYNAATYSWAPPAGLSATTGQSVVASPTITTTYIVTGTNAYGCVNDTSILIVVNPLGVISLGDPVQDVRIYPNPAIGGFTLEFNTTLETPINIYILNMLGEKVRDLHSEASNGGGLIQHKYKVDSSTLTEGIYNVEIVTEQGTVNRRVVLFR